MNWEIRSLGWSARLASKTAAAGAPRQELLIMEPMPFQQRLAIPLGVCAIGIAVSWLAGTPFGLLAPMAAIFLFARGRAVLPLHAASVIGLAGTLFVAAFHGEAAHDLAVTWAAFFAVALCIGAILTSSAADEMRAQEALRDRQRELSQLVNLGPMLLWRVTAEGHATFYNKRLVDFLGVNVADIDKPGMSRLAAHIQTLIHPDDAERALEESLHSLATGENFHSKYRLRRADGVYRWVESRVEPIRDEGERIVQWYGVAFDIDDQMRAEEALRQAHAKLAQATQAAGLAELSASIAHEVNQPLAAIVANSHACHRWLSANPPNVERAKITAERIIRDANSAADVVSRIRALFRQSVEPRSRTPLSGAIAEASSLMAEEAARRRVRLEIDVERNLPLVAFDRVQIQQVLINLIRNGFDAMDSTPDDRVLGMRVRRHGHLIQTEINDRGVGVEFPDKIFEPFFTTKENGMGMGLAICRSIIESHGGRLWAEKNEPRGARFIFTLPQELKTAQ